MTIKLSGYLRDNPGGAAISGKTVNLLDTGTGLAPVTTAHTNLSGTSDVTDANGFWDFTMDLQTGPLYVVADLGGGNTRRRRNDELFQYQAFPINQLQSALQAISTGVMFRTKPPGSSSTELVVTPSATRILTISAGYAIIQGIPFGWDSGTKAVTGTANGSAGTTRHDFLCLRQYYAGSNAGRQEIVLIVGGTSTDPVETSAEGDLTKFIRGANIWDLPIARGKLAFGATVYTVEDLRGTVNYPWAGAAIGNFSGPSSIWDLSVSNNLDVIAGNIDFRSGELQMNGSGAEFDTDIVILQHVISSGTAPTVLANAVSGKAGTGASASISGTDRCGQVTLNMGSGPGIGRQLTVTLALPMPNTSYEIFLQGIEDTAISNAGHHRAMPISTTQWEIEALATPSNNQHKWRYLIEAR